MLIRTPVQFTLEWRSYTHVNKSAYLAFTLEKKVDMRSVYTRVKKGIRSVHSRVKKKADIVWVYTPVKRVDVGLVYPRV